ncbi:MAG TPA: HlyD family type I secretion periplasmic adaptor subunit [Steroidobacteraceae bacterium]|nr:HlyD family type I secretion periplasmic adaptor subunit [Steroidobacteraceae bacterium]
MKVTFESLEPRTSPLDFAPEILALQERPPSPMPRAVLNVLLVLLAALLVWAMVGRVDIVASAQGKLVPQTYVKIVQPADSGVVREILVQEGDFVRAGQVLLRMDTTLSAADASIVAKEVELRELQLRRIESEMSDRPMQRFTGGGDALFREVEAEATGRRRAYEDAVNSEKAAAEQAQEELEGAIAQQAKLEQLLPIYKQEEASLAKLAEEGHVSKFQYAEKQRERIETEQNLMSQNRTVTGLRARITQANSRIAQVTSDYRQRLLSERTEAQGALERARQELAKQEHRSRLSELRAPQDGVIKDVATYTEGAVVSAGSVLMSLVPANEELVAEVFIKNEDVGFVREGQTAKVKLSTYPFQKYGMLDGTVVRISADASEPQAQRGDTEDDEAPPPAISPFKAIVRLNRQSLRFADTEWPISPGMQVVAELKEGERTVMEYLLSPVKKIVGEAGRER